MLAFEVAPLPARGVLAFLSRASTRAGPGRGRCRQGVRVVASWRMPGGKSYFLSAEVLDHVLGGADYSRPGTVHVALFTAAPGDAGGGTECSGGAYARTGVTNNATNFPAASGTPVLKSNGTAITFPKATASWGTVTAFGLFDAANAGNLLYWGSLTTPRAVAIDDTPSFAAGALTITED
jgi:hypothetical protein